VAENTIEGLKTEIPALALAFQLIEKADRLNIMLKRGEAVPDTERGQEMFAIMAERRVTDVMAQGDGLNKILVEMEKAAYGSGDAGDQLHMQNPVGDVVIGDQAEDLSLVDVTGVGLGVEDAVGIQGIGLPVAISCLFATPLCLNAEAGSRRQAALLFAVEVIFDGQQEYF
jgi:hypothetical protein